MNEWAVVANCTRKSPGGAGPDGDVQDYGKPDGFVRDHDTESISTAMLKCPYGDKGQSPAGQQAGNTGVAAHDITPECDRKTACEGFNRSLAPL
jgi:hypothetical protein